ncbi:BON domain-containing protein [Burkholderia cenocepacia]|uniref:BON domain-containing protein n=1 Tax=Burkholderia cenocepacia TaxID=95486 RepID=A0A3S9NL12_9BURK|nr:BON domain-containing protein [Burkholderia cenocepacia]AZQ56343.1 BON domain-containing protein [Burkholderia cenocepacia]
MKTYRMTIVASMFALCSAMSYAQSSAPEAQATAPAPSATSPKAVKKADRIANRAFAKKVRQAIVKNSGAGNQQVVVFANAKTGAVTLAGQITDESQDKAAVDAARQVPGVTSVTSKLQLHLEGGQ